MERDELGSVIRVGKGRGFVVDLTSGDDLPLITTAAHLLTVPSKSLRRRIAYLHRLVGPLGVESSIWVELRSTNPVADIAVLGPVEDQEAYEKYEAYEELVKPLTPFSIADAPLKGQV
jgi:hypothetical protein